MDAVVVGAGPNGLAAAITLAEAGRSVTVFEAAATPGGGCRTAELTLPGFHHDICSTVQALALASPFFQALALDITLCQPEIAFAQPLDGGRAALGFRSVAETAEHLAGDGRAWRTLFEPLGMQLFPDVLSDLRHLPKHPLTLLRFGVPGLLPASVLARAAFRQEPARALFAGLASHSMRKLTAPLTSAFGLVLGASAHTVGWPVVQGGSGRLTDALVERLTSLGGEIVCDSPVTSLAELPPARATMLDITPAQLLTIGPDLPAAYRRALGRFRYSGGIFKVDWALSEPVPWTNPDCRRAGTLHLGGTLAELEASEAAAEAGRICERPYVLAVQATVMDDSRAPAGQHTLWAYCHVPHGSTRDMTAAIEAQVERFAPGFKDTILARSTSNAQQVESYDANYVGGDINGGQASLLSTVLGPVPSWSRYRTPVEGLYLCSSSTPPGGGVHGMSGQLAAREALARELAD